ncbi:TonB-dependent receptor [Pseudochryseolinea flava]|uniref:TonB-dependent receptor n=1 Tax=Pseudochryseolinea flava TaxID=2059302 RepID=A0A364Y9F6_9BACT|nr:TonB-dependent receptor [Pseudochryseolinea flava]RAW02548.1 TonB-dependent receptor [Pseudochryseolinea flava]
MKSIFPFLLFLTILYSAALCQNICKGKIFDSETNEPLVGAAVIIAGTPLGNVTDLDGVFLIDAPTPFDSIVVSYLGYERKTIFVSGREIIVALQSSTNNLQQIVVTANREASLRTESPVAISKISAATINDTKPILLTELLNKVPGVVMLNYNNEQHAMSIRQPMGTSSYFLYLEDGLPVRPMGIFNHNALIEMNILGISNIEVVKGPASSLYGPEAVGGAINFITRKPSAVPTFQIGVAGDAWGYKRIQYGAGGVIGKKLGVHISGFEANQRNAWQTYSDYKKSSVNLRVDYSLSKRTKLSGAFSGNEYYSDMAGSVDSLAFYNREYSSTTDFTYRNVHSQRIRFSINHQWNDGQETLLTVAYRDNYIEQNPNYAIRWTSGSETASGERNRNSFYSRVALVQHSVKFNFLDSKLLAGGSFDYSPTTYWAYKIDMAAQLRPDGKSVERYRILQEQPDQFLSNYQADLSNYALYSQFEASLHSRIRVTLGVRYDRMAFDYLNRLEASTGKKSFEQVTPKIGATFDLLRDKGLYVNYSQGFSPPGLTSIFRKKPGMSGATSEFYYNLEPARFNNIEIGGWGAFLDSKVYVDLAVYQMIGHKELLNIRQTDNTTDYQSAGKTLHRGIEYGFTFKPTPELFIRFGGTNAIHRFEDFTLSARTSDQTKNVDGNEMPQSPRWIANSEVTYKPNYVDGFSVSIEWQRIGSWFQDQTNNVKYDDKGLLGFRGVSYLNLRMGYEVKGFEFFTNVINITDELYANAATRGNGVHDRTTFTPAAPRTFVLGLQYTFKGTQKSVL